MDLLQTIRKSGSRGGVNFSWDDVKSSQHRENYLGHSLMAPVGRWQKNKDLSWYAKADDAELTPEQREEKEKAAKREELRRVKEAEEDAMARAMGLPVPERTNANLEPLGMEREKQVEVTKALKEALGDEDGEERVGLKGAKPKEERRERRRGHDDEERSTKRRRRSRSRSRDRDRERRHRHRHEERSRSRSRERRRHRPSSRDRRRDDDREARRRRDYDVRSRSRERDPRRRHSRSRSRSPYRSRRQRDER